MKEKLRNMDRIRLAALDLDGTTLRSDKSLSLRTEKAIRNAVERGLEIVVASGRPYGALPDFIGRISSIRYAITSNGAAVYDLRTGERIFEYLLSAAVVEQILKLLPKTVILETFIQGVPYAEAAYVQTPEQYGVDAAGKEYIQRTRHPVHDMWGFVLQNRDRLDSLDIITSGQSESDEWKRILEEQIQGIYVTSSVPHMLEISDRGCGKHESLRRLGDILNIQMNEMAAFGDADNDRQMLDLVGFGVAVANAELQIQESADWVTTSNDEDGVAQILEELMEFDRI